MRNLLTSMLTILLALGFAAAQTTPAANDKKSNDKLGTHATPDLPSEAVVESFLHEQFGYQADVTWKIVSIKPSPIGDLAEVNVVLANGQGQQYSRFYVAPDGQHALVGDIIPFGAKPFDPAKKALEKGISGPSKGPKDAAVTIVEFGDLQCPACKAAQPTIRMRDLFFRIFRLKCITGLCAERNTPIASGEPRTTLSGSSSPKPMSTSPTSQKKMWMKS